MKKKLRIQDYLYVGSMLFGLFFGAGNLIFPVHMGQEAGSNVALANLGFLVTGIRYLPFLGVIAFGLSQSTGVFELASRINRRYAIIFTVLLYLVIGPFFALPRLATTSFEIGLVPFVSQDLQAPLLAVFSLLFFGAAWWFSRKPSKILDYVGKFLNPLFLVLLGFFSLCFYAANGYNPRCAYFSSYQRTMLSSPVSQTVTIPLDALASLAFGIIIVTAIRNMGITKPSDNRERYDSFWLYQYLSDGDHLHIAFLYGSDEPRKIWDQCQWWDHFSTSSQPLLRPLWKSALSIDRHFSLFENCDRIDHRICRNLCRIVSCKKLLVFQCCCQHSTGDLCKYRLTKIIEFSTPVLMFVYPLAITLILLAIISPLFQHRASVYRMTTYFTLVAAVIDGLNACPALIRNTAVVQQLLKFAEQYLPFFKSGWGRWYLHDWFHHRSCFGRGAKKTLYPPKFIKTLKMTYHFLKGRLIF